MEFIHKSVLLEETIQGLHIRPDGIYVDGTLGGAGHGAQVCARLSAQGRFISSNRLDGKVQLCPLTDSGLQLPLFTDTY